MKGNKSIIVGVRMDQEMKGELIRLAETDSRSLSDFIRLQLTKLIQGTKKKK